VVQLDPVAEHSAAVTTTRGAPVSMVIRRGADCRQRRPYAMRFMRARHRMSGQGWEMPAPSGGS
jgi:hypothetical protein